MTLRVVYLRGGVAVSCYREQWHDNRREAETVLLAREYYSARDWSLCHESELRDWEQYAGTVAAAIGATPAQG